jgi:hypothetical protein
MVKHELRSTLPRSFLEYLFVLNRQPDAVASERGLNIVKS